MASYIVSYDLRKQRNYQPLWDQLKAWGAVRLLESLWLLTRTENASTVLAALSSLVDEDDGLAVIELKTGLAWTVKACQPTGVTWLKKNFP